MGKNVLKLVAGLALMLSAAATSARAEETTENKVKIQDVTPDKNKTPGNDIDEAITNAKMRAETGSKSRYSMSSQFYYNGGSIEKPLAADRPNISAANAITTVALLEGQVSGKYNLSNASSLMAGVGMRWITPLQGGSTPEGYSGQKFDVDNPYVIYQYLYKWSGIQSAFQVQPTFYTNADRRAEGYVTTLSVAQNNIYELGHSGVSLGLYLLAQTGYFDKKTSVISGKLTDVRGDQSDFVLNFDPFIEYQINNTFNLRTVTNLYNLEHTRAQAANTYMWDKVFQSVGLGISVTRDVFLYPNVQFLPDDIRADKTNVALNSYINLF